MGYTKGISSNVKLPPGSKSGGVEQLSQIMSKVRGGIQVGRVTDIILNGDYPDIEKYGGLNGIGTIFFELNNFISDGNGTARPFFPQLSAYPLVNEMVLIFKLPNTNIGKNTSEESYYYINMISLWNHPHHNAYPNPNKKEDLPSYQQKDYKQTKAGSVRRVTDKSTDIDLNSKINLSQATFKERSNIHPLLPFAGDIIYQGRWGNSIRFGSTAKPPGKLDPLNQWSDTGKNGDPITILTNGQSPLNVKEGWVPITEQINMDLSSIYCTSTQKLPIYPINTNYRSYDSLFLLSNNKPIHPNEFTQPQVIINSDRLVFNAKNDHVLISGEKSIFLGSNESLNFSTGKYVVDAFEIKLGDKDADESLILGDTFLDNLETIMEELQVLCGEISKIKDWKICDLNTGIVDSTPANNGDLFKIAKTLQGMIKGNGIGFLDQISSYKSEVSKTK